MKTTWTAPGTGSTGQEILNLFPFVPKNFAFREQAKIALLKIGAARTPLILDDTALPLTEYDCQRIASLA